MNYRQKAMAESLLESIIVIAIIGGIALGIEVYYGFYGISFFAIIALLLLQKRKRKTKE